MANNFRANWWRQLERVFWLAAATGGLILLLERLDRAGMLAELFSFWRWGGLVFASLAPANSLILPSMLGITATLLIIQLYPAAPPRWIRLVVMGILLLLLTRYCLWRLFVTLNLDDPLSGTLSVLLLIVEVLGWILGIASLTLAALESDRSPEADLMSEAVLRGKYLPWVDVFVPTYNESVAMLRRTIIGCQGMDYPYKRVYLLDDRRRLEMRQLAEELGCYYITRPDNLHAKAGNINHALGKTHGELIAIFDCDFVPTRNFLTRTIGFFQQPDIALVQTNKAYYNSDPIRHNLGLQTALTNDEDIFFGAILSGRDAANSVICCGSSFVVRRRVLDEIGGIPTETLTEDFLTSLKIQALGDRVIYLNEPLSAGLAAENIGGYIDQRLRWGQGTIQSLFCRANPFTMPGLNLLQRFIHGLGIIYWFQSAAYVIFLCLPIAYLWFGIEPIRASIEELVFFFFPYYFTFGVVFAWLNGGRRSVFWAEVYGAIIAFPVAFMVINTLIAPFSKGFKVTPKGVSAKKAVLNWQAASPLVILLLLYLVSVGFQVLNWQWIELSTSNIGLFWAIYNTCILFIAIQIAIDVPQEVLAIRFPHQLPCRLRLGEQTYYGITSSLSEWGTNCSFSIYSIDDNVSNRGFIDIPCLQLFNVSVVLSKPKLDKYNNLNVELQFLELSLSDRRKLVNFVFGQPDRWQTKSISEIKSFWSLISSMFRIYPLTRDFKSLTPSLKKLPSPMIMPSLHWLLWL